MALNFKNKAGYKKWLGYIYANNLNKPGGKPVKIAGKPHKVKRNKKGGIISKLKGGGTGIWAGKSPGVDTATTIDGVTYYKKGGILSLLRKGGKGKQGYLDKVDEGVSASLKEPLSKLKKGGQGYYAREDESIGMRLKHGGKANKMAKERDMSYGDWGNRSKDWKGTGSTERGKKGLKKGGQGYLDRVDEGVSASLKEPLSKLKKGGRRYRKGGLASKLSKKLKRK